MDEFFLTLFSITIILCINKYRKIIAQKMNLFDVPDNIRKFHIINTPLIGGIMIFSTLFFLFLYILFYDDNNKTNLFIFIASFFIFFIGLIDDILDLSYKYKFISLFIIFTLFVTLDPSLQITKIYFSTFDKFIYFNSLSVLFTVICLLLLTNAINLIDGIDGFCILIIIIIFSWILLTFENNNFIYVILTSLILILVLNLRRNVFLGDSGSLFLGSLVGLLIISNYNNALILRNFPVEDIFIVLMLPGIDMLRVFFIRIANRRNPFSSDRNHLHHLLLDKNLKLHQILIIIVSLYVLPIFVNSLSIINSFLIILISIIVYIIIILKIKNHRLIK